MNKCTADHISVALLAYLSQPYVWVLPNVFIGRFERDVVRVDKNSEWWSEYEIKISRADFKQDFKKQVKFFSDDHVTSKHAELKAGDPLCPNRFWFVVPRDLVKAEEVPEHAGLIYFDSERGATPWAQFQIIKTGKLIHRVKVEDAWKVDLLEKSYSRYYDIRWKYENARRQLKYDEFGQKRKEVANA